MLLNTARREEDIFRPKQPVIIEKYLANVFLFDIEHILLIKKKCNHMNDAVQHTIGYIIWRNNE